MSDFEFFAKFFESLGIIALDLFSHCQLQFEHTNACLLGLDRLRLFGNAFSGFVVRGFLSRQKLFAETGERLDASLFRLDQFAIQLSDFLGLGAFGLD